MIPVNAPRQRVYIMGPDRGPYKIGMSLDALKRRNNITGRNRNKIHREFGVRYPKEIEKSAHALLEDKALGGEWFNCTLKEAEEAVLAAIAIFEALRQR